MFVPHSGSFEGLGQRGRLPCWYVGPEGWRRIASFFHALQISRIPIVPCRPAQAILTFSQQIISGQPRSPAGGGSCAGLIPRQPQQYLAVPTGVPAADGPSVFVPRSSTTTRSNVTSGPRAGVMGAGRGPAHPVGPQRLGGQEWQGNWDRDGPFWNYL